MSRRKKQNTSSGGGEWLTTFADLMTLLLTFFVLLYSFSSIDAIKFKQIAISLSSAFGGKTGVINHGGNLGPIPIDGNPGVENKIMENAGLKGETEKNYKQVADFIKKHKLEDKVSIKEDSRGVIIEMQEKILFDSGKSELKKSSLEVINKICELLKQFPNEIIVEGHTDNIPINKGYFRSNWELSADRAVKVVRYMSEVNGLNPKQFKAVGCGEFSPIADNNSPEGRQKNRRVNILIVSTEKENKDNGSKKE